MPALARELKLFSRLPYIHVVDTKIIRKLIAVLRFEVSMTMFVDKLLLT